MNNISQKRQLLAGFPHAHRVALQLSKANDVDVGIAKTGDPRQPFRVVQDNPKNPNQIFRVQKG
jgi:hypothetical protein